MINMMTAMSVSKSYCHKEIQIVVSQLDKPFLIDRANLASFKSIVDAKIIRIFLNINIFLEYMERVLCQFQTFLLPKLANFF